MKKFLHSLIKARWALPALIFGALPSFAQESVPSAFEDALDDLQSGVTGMIDKVVPVVSAILVALLVFVGLFMAWRYVKKAAK